jgi:alpha-1,2-mannosyltransferase
MDRRPVVAGACFGAMAYKPHLALVIPFALIFARRWRTLIVAAVTAASFCLASLIAFGASAWSGFFADASFAGAALQNNLVGNEKMQSVFAAVRLLHGSLALAWGAQIAAALCAIGALWLLQWRAFRTAAEAPAVVCAGLLASPFVLDYDLTLGAIPLVWLLGEGRRAGFLPFEKALMGLAFALPLISRIAAGAVGLPLAPLTIAAVLALILRRALMPTADSAARRQPEDPFLPGARTMIGCSEPLEFA